MKKKTIAIMMTAAMVMAMAAGCGSKESSSSDGNNKEASYKIGIQQFADTDHWITAGKVSWKDWKRKAQGRR